MSYQRTQSRHNFLRDRFAGLTAGGDEQHRIPFSRFLEPVAPTMAPCLCRSVRTVFGHSRPSGDQRGDLRYAPDNRYHPGRSAYPKGANRLMHRTNYGYQGTQTAYGIELFGKRLEVVSSTRYLPKNLSARAVAVGDANRIQQRTRLFGIDTILECLAMPQH